MNIDLYQLIWKIPRGCVSSSEKLLLLAVADSIPTFDPQGKKFALEPKVREPEKKRIGKAGILERRSITIPNYDSMFLCDHRHPFDEAVYQVEEQNPVMRLNDMLMNEDNLSISVLSKKTGLSQSSIRCAKHSLIKKGYLVYKQEGNKQYWIIKAGFISGILVGAKTEEKHFPKRARPKTVALNKQRARERELEKIRAEEEQKRERLNEISWARHFHIPVAEFRQGIKEGKIWRDEEGDYFE